MLAQQSFFQQPAAGQDYFNSQTDHQSGQPVQGYRPANRFSQGDQRLQGNVQDGQGLPTGGYVAPYGKPTMGTAQNRRDNPESVYHGKASTIPRPYQRQLPIGVPIQGTNSLNAGAQQLNGSVNQNPPARPARPGGRQAVFNLNILVPDATFSGKRGKVHYVTVIYPGKNPRLPNDDGVHPFNSSWANVDVVDNTKGVVPIVRINASYSRAASNRGTMETIYVNKGWTSEHPRGFNANVSGQFSY